MLGSNESDALFLQVKAAEAAVLSRFAGASKYANQGQRVVGGQRLAKKRPPVTWGWTMRAIGGRGVCRQPGRPIEH
jgi:Uncharacterized protein conserved in bacteria (DUF2252)